MNVNEECILFLYKSIKDGGYETEGDYYYISGLSQGLLRKIPTNQIDIQKSSIKSSANENPEYFSNIDMENSEKTRPGKTVIDANHEIINKNTFSNEAEEFNKQYPVEVDYYKNEVADNLKNNLDGGMITQKEYDEYTKELFQQNPTESYAEIIE